MDDWRELMDERSCRKDKPMKPQVVASELGKQLKDNAVIIADSGTIAVWYARHIPVKKGQMCSLSGNLASMANGFPYAIAAQIAYPERQVVAFVGDGGFSMLMAEMATCVKYKLPIKVVIIKNNTLGQIRWEQMVFNGNPEYEVELQPIDFAAAARAFGIKGYTIEEPKKCASILNEALSYNGPAIIEAVVDPYEPPMPAKITYRQAKKFAKSLIKGEPNRDKIALTVAKDRVKELI
jgi:pyruvate dehydrogenase (quinone)/pyruvate oxidase